MKIKFEDFRKESNIPLYIQVMEIIKYQIATGNIKEGERLPSIRALADEWNIHMHTIRHAYKELELLGLIEIRRPLGAIVTSNLSEVTLHDAEEIDSFIRSTVSEAKNRFNLSPEELVSLIERGAGLTTLTEQPNWFIECNSSQINDHIAQISASWDVNINPLLLSHEGLLPEGNIISTYFHFNDIRSKWPEQFHRITFVSISPSLKIRDDIERFCSDKGKITITVCDQSEEQSLAIHADLRQIFSQEKYGIKTAIVNEANELIHKSDGTTPLLFTPRVWSQLTEEEQNAPDVFKVVYQLNRKDLNYLGNRNMWNRVIKKQGV